MEKATGYELQAALNRIRALEAERDLARGLLIHLATCLQDRFSCTFEGGEDGHNEIEDCWSCWADHLLDPDALDVKP